MTEIGPVPWACSGPVLAPPDLRIGRRLGLQIFQVAVNWPALQPKGRGFRRDPALLDPYDRVVDHLLEQELEPQFSLHGGELPTSLQLDGGWTRRDNAKRFVDFAEGMSRRLGDRVERWLTLQDLTAIASWEGGELHSADGPGLRYLKACHHLLLAHAWASKIIAENVHSPHIDVEFRCPELGPEADRDEDPSHHRWILDPLSGQGYPEEGLHDRRDQGVLSSLVPSFAERGDLQLIGSALGGIRLIVDWPWRAAHYGPFERVLHGLSERPLSLHLRQGLGASQLAHPANDEARVELLRDQLESLASASSKGLNLQQIQLGPLLDEEQWADGARPQPGLVWIDPYTRRRWPKASGLFVQRFVVEGHVARTDLGH
ncbi:MAG: hypothetical protein CMH55_01065 [Myxococcales bacterium]|nr:hypothetical protein [Myxococcales bacterium]